MATPLLRTPPLRAQPAACLRTVNSISSTLVCVSLGRKLTWINHCRISHSTPHSRRLSPGGTSKFLCFASNEETIVTGDKQQVEELQDNSEGVAGVEDDGSQSSDSDHEEPPSSILASLQSYKEAVANNNESKVAEIEALLVSIEDEKFVLEGKVAKLSDELSYERDRILRISADFDNFRKRTERERLSFVTNAQGELLENLLPMLDNFERAKDQIKVESEKEEKISNSYQSIYKQFVEILSSLGVVPVETIGKPFDPLLHEAIMREDSAEFEEGVILQEFRKGFKLGDRLLRPSMVKVSAGPGPASNTVPVEPSEEAEASVDREVSAAEPSEEPSE